MALPKQIDRVASDPLYQAAERLLDTVRTAVGRYQDMPFPNDRAIAGMLKSRAEDFSQCLTAATRSILFAGENVQRLEAELEKAQKIVVVLQRRLGIVSRFADGARCAYESRDEFDGGYDLANALDLAMSNLTLAYMQYGVIGPEEDGNKRVGLITSLIAEVGKVADQAREIRANVKLSAGTKATVAVNIDPLLAAAEALDTDLIGQD